MVDAPVPEVVPAPEAAARARRGLWPLRWMGRFALALGLAVAALLAGLVVLDSSIGHRFVVERIAALTPGSGLRIRIGRIDGSLYGRSTLRNVVLSDPQGRFLTVPEARLDWRPFSWLKRGLDVRKLVLRRGTLLRAPRLNPGDPNSPILPDFDIRIDRLVVDNLTVAKGVMGERRRVDIVARADIRSGRALVDVKTRLGGRDRLVLHLDSEPDRDKFDLAAAYDAPKNGLLAALTGVKHDIHARIAGRGRFAEWQGWVTATQDGAKLAAFLLRNRAGHYDLAGQVFPAGLLHGTAADLVGERLSLVYRGGFSRGHLDGGIWIASTALRLTGKGGIDLANNRANDFRVNAVVTQPDRLFTSPHIEGLALNATLNGRFTDLAIDHVLTLASLRSGGFVAEGLRSAGVAHWDGKRLRLPMAITARTVHTGSPQLDPHFVGGRVSGDLVLAGHNLTSERVAIDLKGLTARLVLRGDTARGGYALAGPVAAKGFALRNLGLVDADAKILFKIGRAMPWTVQANAAGRMGRIDNATLAGLSGGNIRFTGGLAWGERIPLAFRNARFSSRKLALAVDGAIQDDGRTTLAGKGRHLDYGAFTISAQVIGDGPRAQLVFDNPLPSAGLKDVHVALAPIADGFGIATSGQSALGPFTGSLGLFSPPGGPTRVAIQFLRVWQTDVTGSLVLGKAGMAGDLALKGGGLDGTVHLAPQDSGPDGPGGQGVKALVLARKAKFGGTTPLSIGNARINVDGLFADGNSTLTASLEAQGVGVGKLFVGRMAANATLVNGSGSVTASVAGRRGTQFALQGTAAFEPDKVVAYVAGNYAGRSVDMPRRLVMDREGEGWRLQPTQVNFGRGVVIGSGHLFGGPTEIDLQVARMPLSLVDIAVADLGLGGLASGVVQYRNDHGGAPSGHAALQVKGLTRSGLVLTSRPLDLFLVGELDPAALQTRAVVKDGGAVRGRLQAVVSDIPRGGAIIDRLRAGHLRAQVRYSGAADALWRLASVEVFDLTGTLGAVANVTGTIDNPVISGALASRDLRVQSALVGTDVQKMEVAGTFTDSRLSLSRFSGTAPNGGKVVGSGTIDLSNLTTQGVGLDLRLAATNAQLIRRDDMAATVTGPLRIVSTGSGGTIAGRVRLDRASWTLGKASTAQDLPVIATREMNAPADIAPPRAPAVPWTFMIDASAANRVDVHGMGLDSEWSADIRLRGTTASPQIFGAADLVRGGYQFAGKRFELTRGRIRFNGELPVDPRLDIAANGDANGVTATITITGSSNSPSIAFTSTPALPEEELLSRLLFGSSITQISAPEAVQLAAALASLRGGGGLDPLNKLRSAIGLDRLRIVGADTATGRGTSIAVGKYLGRRFFVELVTDGKGYSATSIEFRITRWLALLGTISTIGDESINLKASKDY